MKKLLFAMIVSVFTLTIAFSFTANASTAGYTWLNDYEATGKLMMYPKAIRDNLSDTMGDHFGYSGVDVVLGNFVVPIARGNVLTPGDNMAIANPGWGSLAQLYINNKTETWYIPRSVESSFILLFIDESGQVYQIDDNIIVFNIGACYGLDGTPIVPTDPATQCKQAEGDVQLRYLDSNLEKTLDKADIEANKADGITFADGELVYKTAEGKYTNVATDNTAVTKQKQSVFAATDPEVVAGDALVGELKYQYTLDGALKYTKLSAIEGYVVTPVMGNVKGLTWSNGTVNTNLDADYDADNNGDFGFTNFVPAAANTYYDFWWNEETNTREFRATANQKHMPHVDIQLTYADLNGGINSTYYWLTKTTVDNNTATGVTLTDTDLLYKDAAGKYTNVAEGNTPVMNADLGFDVPAGHSVLALEYWDRSKYNNATYIQSFYNLVNGVDGTASVVEHDVTKPVFKGVTASYDILINTELDIMEGITATDTGLFKVLGDEISPLITTTIYAFNKTTNAYDIVVPEVDLTLAGREFHIVYSATDAAGNVATQTSVVRTVAGYSPIFTGISNKTINEGQAIDLLAGITATDGYDNDITSNIQVFKGAFYPAGSKAGVYEIIYAVTNANNTTTFATAKITVLDTTAPRVLPVADITIMQGTDFDLTSPIIAFDNVDTEFDKVVADDDDFDFNTPGTYTIEIEVYDLSGNITTITYNIEVIATGTDDVSRIADLEDALDAANQRLTEKQTQIEEIWDKLEQLKKDTDALSQKSEDNNQTGVILTAIVALVAVGGASLGATSLFKRH